MFDCSLTSQLELVKADIAAYRALEHYHYRAGAMGPYCAIYALAERCAQRQKVSRYAGVIVYAPAPLNCAARNAAVGGFFAKRSKPDRLARLNAHLRRISRVIIEPRYRGLGLAVRLVRDTLALADVSLVEASATMGQLHPFFERAGMKAYAPLSDPQRQHLEQTLADAGIDPALWLDPAATHAAIDALPLRPREHIETAMQRFVNRFGKRRTMPPGPARTAFVLSRLGAAPIYYLWRHPDCCIPPPVVL